MELHGKEGVDVAVPPKLFLLPLPVNLNGCRIRRLIGLSVKRSAAVNLAVTSCVSGGNLELQCQALVHY